MGSTLLSTPIINELNLPVDNTLVRALESNLQILRCNAVGSKAQWDEFVQHLCWPEEVAPPEGLFLIDITTSMHYKLAMRHIEELYPY